MAVQGINATIENSDVLGLRRRVGVGGRKDREKGRGRDREREKASVFSNARTDNLV